ncbi:MAG: ANTAR domain-containing response regulator [Phycisphaerales bacterium]
MLSSPDPNRVPPPSQDASTGGGPAKQSEPRLIAERDESKLPDRPRRILIADDEHLMASGVASHLQTLGYTVVAVASDGRSAIHSSETEIPDLCLLDIRMPEVDGLVAARTIWHELGIPSVLISAYSNDEYIQRASDTGVFGYLLKPVSAEDLRVTIPIAWSTVRQQDAINSRAKQLQRTLAQRRTIEEAKWILVRDLGLDESTSHSTMQRHARSTRQTLHDTAVAIINGEIEPQTLIPKPKPPKR